MHYIDIRCSTTTFWSGLILGTVGGWILAELGVWHSGALSAAGFGALLALPCAFVVSLFGCIRKKT
jgi:hypothetical protein